MSHKDILRKVKSFAKGYCDRSNDKTLWDDHVRLVRKYALKLAKIEKADKQVVEIASLLHDIGKYEGRENHNVRSYELSKPFLEELNIPKIELTLACILKHNAKFSEEDNEIEVKVLQSADALGVLFDYKWQEHSRKTMPRDRLLRIYDKTISKLNLNSAKEIAAPQIEKLRAKLNYSPSHISSK